MKPIIKYKHFNSSEEFEAFQQGDVQILNIVPILKGFRMSGKEEPYRDELLNISNNSKFEAEANFIIFVTYVETV